MLVVELKDLESQFAGLTQTQRGSCSLLDVSETFLVFLKIKFGKLELAPNLK